MRLLCVITNLDTGGAQRQLVNLACGLKRRGHYVEFFAYYPQDFFRPVLDKAGIRVMVCPKPSRFSFAPVWQLRRRIKEGSFDVVLAFLETATVYAELACVGLSGVRVIVSERNCATNDNVSVEVMVKSRLHKLAHTVVVNSHAHREWMAARFPFLCSRLVSIWNGVDTDVFCPAGNPLNNGTVKLLGVGRITPQKNLPALVHALAECRGNQVPVTLDWAGKADNQYCHRMVLDAIQHDRMEEFWGWLGVRNDIPALLGGYDALILPSLWEGLPNVICEALAAGLPVLASNVADNALLVQNGVTGYIFNPKNPGAIANAITQFARLNQESRVRFGRAARIFAENSLSLNACIDAYEDVLVAGSAACRSA